MKENIITSRSNSYIKKVFSLLNKKGRDETGLFWAEGTKAVESALNSKKFEICDVVISDEAGREAIKLSKIAEKKDFQIKKINRDCFNKISALRHPEGIGVVVKTNVKTGLPDKIDKPLVILWQLNNPGNQGTIIRSAAAFGCAAVVIVEPCVDEYHPMCIRATSGAFFTIDVLKSTAENLLPWIEKNKNKIIILTPDGKKEIKSENLKSCKILIVGNEPHGITNELKNTFETAGISMNPEVESLNTSCAASIAMYELWGKEESAKGK